MNSLGAIPNLRLILAILVSVKGTSRTQATLAQGGAVPVTGLKQEDNAWATKKYSHKFRSLTENEMKKVASRSNEALLRSFLETIMIPRVPGSDGHHRVGEFLVNTMKGLDWQVERDSFEMTTPLGVKSFSNIIATLPLAAAASSSSSSSSSPTSYSLPPRRLAMACHYDSKYFKGKDFLAATDSAVPCAMMLHLASTMNEYLHRHRTRNTDVTLEFLFFDGEEAFVNWSDEDSIYGSRHLAQLWQDTPFSPYLASHSTSSSSSTTRLDSLDFLMLLDLIGESQPRFHNFFASTSRHFERLMRIEKKMSKAGLLTDEWGQCTARNGCNRYFQSATVVSSFIEDDHIPFLRRNVPVLHMIPYPFPREWHKLSDDGNNLHYPTIYNLNKIFAAFVAEYLGLPLK